MVLIIGGVYQGKLDYAISTYKLSAVDVFNCCENTDAIPWGCKVINEFEKWILALVKSGIDVAPKVQEFIHINQDAIVIANDISCGVVPIDGLMRKWREESSRATGQVAIASDEILRLYCGIATRLAP